MKPAHRKKKSAAQSKNQVKASRAGTAASRGSSRNRDLEALVHELEVHQVELQTQNEELRRSHDELEESRRKYSDLYDFAPIGYFTLDSSGVIREVNLTGAALLGIERRRLIQRGFRRFVKGSCQATFISFCEAVFSGSKIQTCEVTLRHSTGTSFDARLTGITLQEERGERLCQVAVSDVSDWREAQRAVEQAQRELEIRMQERTAVMTQLQERSAALKQSNELLQVQIQERVRAEQETFRQSQQLEGLSRRLLRIQEAERRQLALDLHDQLGQVLTGIRLNLQQAQRESRQAKAGKRLTEAIGMLDSALNQVRQWSFDLRPPLLDDLGLASALRWYLDRQVRGFVIPHLKTPRSEKRLPSEVETTCFRLAQEALTNVVRHAKAKNVWIELRQNSREAQLELRDDGLGFDVAVAQNRAVTGASLGLLGMQERVRLCQGKLEIISSPGCGTKVLATLPLTFGAGTSRERRRRARHYQSAG